MNRGTPTSRAAAFLLLIAALVVAYGLIGWPLQSAYQNSLVNIAEQRLALARLEAAQARSDALLARQRSGDGNDLNPLVLAETDGSAAAILQSHLQSLLETNGAELTSVEALQAEAHGQFRAINVRAQFTTGHEALREILFALESGRPVVFLDNVTISARSVRAFGIDRPLDIQVDLTAFRAVDS